MFIVKIPSLRLSADIPIITLITGLSHFCTITILQLMLAIIRSQCRRNEHLYILTTIAASQVPSDTLMERGNLTSCLAQGCLDLGVTSIVCE